MKKIWISILKPKGIYAKWLILAVLAGLAWLWANGHFEIARQYLDIEQLTLTVGTFKITLYAALKALLSIVLIFWTTAIVSEFADNRISSMKKMRVANKALLQKVLQIIIYVIAFLMMLNLLGIDLTSLTILSGAIGIGLGFGLQKIASNFVSGIILLLERSLKPGDLIELVDGTFGYVRKSSSRATLIETFDGKEILVPNEEFIINQVVNWTLSNNKARVTVNLGVSYGSNIEKARDLALEAVNSHERSLKDPAAACYLDNFGDSSVDFILYFWVADANQGLRNVKSEVMFSIWNKFKENDIEIPFPQRDLHIKNAELMKSLSHDE
jgi:small-conductance mechanosensitive channel